MKKCINCGTDNKNDNIFCSACGGNEFSEPYSADDAAPAVPQPPLQQPQQPQPVQDRVIYRETKKPFGIFDVFTILGFVSSIVGLFCIWVVLEPLAIASSVIGFFKGTRYKGLAATGIVISIIAFIVILFITLYNGNIIGKWAIDGALNRR